MDKANNKFTYWYPVSIEKQLDFECHEHVKEVLLEGHIVFGGRLMCGGEREQIMKETKAEKEKASPKPLNTKVCRPCMSAYKEHPESPYYRFVHGIPIPAVGTILRPSDEAKTKEETVSTPASA